MYIKKEKLEMLVKDLPENVDIGDVMFRLYLLQKAELRNTESRADQIEECKDVPHDEALISNFTAAQFSRASRRF